MKITHVPPPVVQGKVILELTENEYALLQYFAWYYAATAPPARSTNAADRFAEGRKSPNLSQVDSAFVKEDK